MNIQVQQLITSKHDHVGGIGSTSSSTTASMDTKIGISTLIVHDSSNSTVAVTLMARVKFFVLQKTCRAAVELAHFSPSMKYGISHSISDSIMPTAMLRYM